MYTKLAYHDESIDCAEAGTITLPDASDCVVARIAPHAVQLASGDHRYDLDHDLGRLFAAAPDLLAALRELTIAAEAAGWDVDKGYAPVLNAGRAAIAEAEGR